MCFGISVFGRYMMLRMSCLEKLRLILDLHMHHFKFASQCCCICSLKAYMCLCYCQIPFHWFSFGTAVEAGPVLVLAILPCSKNTVC